MVSFRSPFPSPKDQRNMISIFEGQSSASTSTNKKRSRENDSAEEADHGVLSFHHQKNPKTFSDLGLHLNTPDLPSEWKRFLDTKSGQMYFYDSKTDKRTLKDDPREESKVVEPVPEPDSEPWSPSGHMSLDLELNLPCGPRSFTVTENKLNKQQQKQDSDTKPQINGGIFLMNKYLGDKGQQSPSLSLSSSSSPPPTSLEGDDELQEMVATVCTKCHMLVMLCKSFPACPNCKFMHPPDHCPPYLCKQRLSLLC